jgi:hypothetical protein
LLQLVDDPEQAPDQVYIYEPVPPDTEEMKVTVWLVLADTGEAEQLTVKSAALAVVGTKDIKAVIARTQPKTTIFVVMVFVLLKSNIFFAMVNILLMFPKPS